MHSYCAPIKNTDEYVMDTHKHRGSNSRLTYCGVYPMTDIFIMKSQSPIDELHIQIHARNYSQGWIVIMPSRLSAFGIVNCLIETYSKKHESDNDTQALTPFRLCKAKIARKGEEGRGIELWYKTFRQLFWMNNIIVCILKTKKQSFRKCDETNNT